MHHDLDFIRAKVKQPVRFDDFETLIHESRGVDRNAIPHLPGRMLQSIGRRHPLQGFFGRSPKRTARGGQDEFRRLARGVPHGGTDERRCARNRRG